MGAAEHPRRRTLGFLSQEREPAFASVRPRPSQAHVRKNQELGWSISDNGKKIGDDPRLVAIKLTDLFRDIKAQIADQSDPIDAIAARFHHRLVSIHPFPNGNGRFSRTMTDLLLKSNGREVFSWGGGSLDTGEIRSRYISALRAADAHDLNALFAFVRSGSKKD